jgi:hypothetical protein
MSQSSNAPGSPKNSPRRPFQYSLRTLFLVVTLIAVFLAIEIRVSGAVTAILLIFLLLIGAHVFANAHGTAMRSRTDEQLAERDPNLANETQGPKLGTPLPKFDPQELGRRNQLGWGPFGCALPGALAGACLGGKLLEVFAEVELFSAASWLGIISSGILGGLFAFLAASLMSAIARAWSEVK